MEKENSFLSSAQEQRYAQDMKTLKETMLRLAMSRHPSLSHSQHEMLEKHIDVRLPSLFPSQLRTPNHPPYAWMIRAAIEELKKKKGSTKPSISSFIKSNYQHLPLAHEHLLAHHLEKLVKVGEILYVNSLYKLPIHYISNSEKQQQEGEQQLIVEGGKMLEREMGKNDVNGGELVAIPEKHHTTVAELIEPVDDGFGGGRKHSAAVTELMDPLHKKRSGRSRGRPPKKISKVEQQQMEVVNISEQIPSKTVASAADDPAVDHHSLEQPPRCRGRPCSQEVAMQDDDGGLRTLCEKHPTAGIEVVKPLQKKLSGRGRGRAPNKTSEAEQQQENVEKISESSMAAAVADDDDLASEFQRIQSQEQISRLQSRPLEKVHEDKQEGQVLTMQDEEGSLVSVTKEPMTAVPEDKDCHPFSSNLELEHQQQQRMNGGDLLSMAAVDDFLSEFEICQSQEQQQRLQGGPLEKEHEDKIQEQELAMEDEERLLVSVIKEPSTMTVTMVVEEDRGCHPFSSNLEQERQQQQGERKE